MELFNNNKVKSIAFIILFGLSFSSFAQCKKFTKKSCLPSLSPYTNNGQLTTAYMSPGDSADVSITFNAGKSYRILICSQESIGKVQFKVYDKNRKILYQSKEDEINPFWDFKMTSTQQLYIQITIPKPDTENSHKLVEMLPNGCVSLLIGFKQK